jgi:competence protein ComEA
VSAPPRTSPSAAVVVDVTGAVRRPGLVELPGGSRVDDALTAAGGATRKADLSSVNLARPLVDGEQIVVLRRGQTAGPVGVSVPGAPGSAPGPPLDLNTATTQSLDALPGVGPVLAQRIIDWRTQHGRFTSVDELTEVSGIGERTLADLRSLVRV